MAEVNLSGHATVPLSMLTTNNTLGHPLMNAVGSQKVFTHSVHMADRYQTLIVRYEQVENGWLVSIAKHEGENFKRYISESLEDAHKQVSAYIAAERLER